MFVSEGFFIAVGKQRNDNEVFFATDLTKQEPQPPENRQQPALSSVCMTSRRRPLHSIYPGLSACVCRTYLCLSHQSVINAFLKWCIVKITYLYNADFV